MRVVRFQEFGGPEVLAVTRAPAPRPGPGQVAIDVAYAGVNFADIKARSEGYRVPSLPFVPGLEVSGWIRAVGDGVTGLEAGQAVAALTPGGAYAEAVVVDAATVFALPDGLDLRTAATLPTVLPTAHALLHEAGRLRVGETVLVQGAAGGVGTVVGQLARAAGAGRVYGVVSREAKAEYALRHGYDEVFVGEFADGVRAATGGRGVDLALDPVGGETFRRSLEALAPFGRLVSYGNASAAEPWRLGQPELFPGAVSVAGFSILTLAATAPDALREIAARAFRAVAEGVVHLPVTAEFPLAEAAEAHRLVETRATTGKLLLRVAG
ncbi:quinone oxidoreductase family protein [Streptomyces huiliensis]|uniref:quinone oxidoreductase family protein n=1 Tax=Streptomyces huiliensis TaxID=2876027 RepID=UPI001CBE14A9|nr:zinc-binding dehydrogenase [Streptomyces huiliensis]MBZ4318398.1 zinc-binding dehydrogenase [Streptomyces huiliensis]